jgi:hypothetical protein
MIGASETKLVSVDVRCTIVFLTPPTMARLWLTFGVLTPLLAIFIIQRTSLAENYWPWFLATHPDSAQAGEPTARRCRLRARPYPGTRPGDQQPLQVSTPPPIVHHAWDTQGDLPEDAFVRRIVAVGDLHGDFGNARKVLEMSGVIDEGREMDR